MALWDNRSSGGGLFGGGGMYGGLLDPEFEQSMTEEERKRLQRNAMLESGLAMLSMSGYQNTPVTLGEALGMGMMAGRQAYQGGASQMQQQRAMTQKAREEQMQREQQRAWLESLPPDQRQLAQVMGVGDFAKQEAQTQAKIRAEKAKTPSETSLDRNLQAAGLQKGTPEYQQAMRRAIFQSKAPSVVVNNGGASPFDKALAEKGAAAYDDYQQQAYAAGSTLESIDVLRQVNSLQQGGKIGEAAAVVGQYFGSDAGANMQTFKAAQSQMVLKAAESLKGAMSDRDIQLLEETLPQYGNDPRANEVILQILERAAQKKIQNFEQADQHVNQTGSLRGFRPLLNAPGQQGPTNAADIDLDALSEDEIAAELARRRRRSGR